MQQFTIISINLNSLYKTLDILILHYDEFSKLIWMYKQLYSYEAVKHFVYNNIVCYVDTIDPLVFCPLPTTPCVLSVFTYNLRYSDCM